MTTVHYLKPAGQPPVEITRPLGVPSVEKVIAAWRALALHIRRTAYATGLCGTCHGPWRTEEDPAEMDPIHARLRELTDLSDEICCALDRTIYHAYEQGMPETEIAAFAMAGLGDVRAIIARQATDAGLLPYDGGRTWITVRTDPPSVGGEFRTAPK